MYEGIVQTDRVGVDSIGALRSKGASDLQCFPCSGFDQRSLCKGTRNGDRIRRGCQGVTA